MNALQPMGAKPEPFDADDIEPSLGEVVKALQDDDCVFVRMCLGYGAGTAFIVGVRGTCGVRRFVDLVQDGYSHDGTEDGAGVDTKIGLYWIEPGGPTPDPHFPDCRLLPPALVNPTLSGDPNALPEWTFLVFGIDERVRGDTTTPGLLRAFASSLRSRRSAWDERQGKVRLLGWIPRGKRATPKPVPLDGGMESDVRALAAAFMEDGVVVLNAGKSMVHVMLVVAARGALGVRRLCESLRRIEARLGHGRNGFCFQEEVALRGAEDAYYWHRLRYAGWVTFWVKLHPGSEDGGRGELRAERIVEAAKAVMARPRVMGSTLVH